MPTVSFCCIFKNEEKHLPKWIDNAKKIANGEGDEIIAVDTGSTDRSVEILKKAGIEPYYFEWVNDFSKAKNFALSKATGDWIIFLDCDEYFNDDSITRVRQIIDEQDKDEETKVIESFMLNVNEDDNNALISQFIHWRIFRNTEDLRYVKAIHEALSYTGPGMMNVFRSNLVIMHTGYSAGLTRIKGQRNLEFLQREIAKNETGEITTQQAYYLANSYAQLGDLEKTAHYSRIAIKGTDDELGFMTVRMYRNLVQEEEQKPGGGDFDKKMDILDRGLLRVPEHPDFLMTKMLLTFPLKHFYEIEHLCHKMLEKIDDPEINNKYETDIISNMQLVYNMLSNVKFHKGDVVESRRYALMALQEKPHAMDLLLNFVKCFRGEELSIIKPLMDMIYPHPSYDDTQVIREYFSAMPYTDTYLHYVKPKDNTYEYYMCKGEYHKALKLCEKELLRLFKIAAFCHAKYPKETENLKLTTPEKYLRGPKKPPKGELTLKDLTDNFISLFSKIILACFSMDEKEFEAHRGILNLLVSPTKDFISAGFNIPCSAVSIEDLDRFYNEIAPFAAKTAMSRLAHVIAAMPDLNEEFLINIVKDLLVKKELQGAYDIVEKLKDKDAVYYTLMGITFFYANDLPKAREHFIKARELGGGNQEVRDFIKWTDPARDIEVKL